MSSRLRSPIDTAECWLESSDKCSLVLLLVLLLHRDKLLRRRSLGRGIVGLESPRVAAFVFSTCCRREWGECDLLRCDGDLGDDGGDEASLSVSVSSSLPAVAAFRDARFGLFLRQRRPGDRENLRLGFSVSSEDAGVSARSMVRRRPIWRARRGCCSFR